MMMMRLVHKFAVALLLLVSLMFAGSAYPQGGATRAIAGSVLDTTGAAVSAADVQIVNASTGSVVRKLSTNLAGEFVATLLPPGTYHELVNKSGFGHAN